MSGVAARIRWWAADRLRPNVWPSTAAQHGVLLEQIKELSDDASSAAWQAAFWRARAIELGAEEDEWRRKRDSA